MVEDIRGSCIAHQQKRLVQVQWSCCWCIGKQARSGEGGFDLEVQTPQQHASKPDSLGVFLWYTRIDLETLQSCDTRLLPPEIILCSVTGLDELELARALHRVGTLQPGPVVDCGLSGSICRPCWNPIRPLLQAAPVQL